MSDERLRWIAEQVDRRTLLRRATSATVGLVLGLFGASTSAQALTPWHCCTLCFPPSVSCSGCACVYCWFCTEGDTTYKCCECHTATSDCGENCNNVNCSWGQRTGFGPSGSLGAPETVAM
jgi:hypothetical protein